MCFYIGYSILQFLWFYMRQKVETKLLQSVFLSKVSRDYEARRFRLKGFSLLPSRSLMNTPRDPSENAGCQQTKLIICIWLHMWSLFYVDTDEGLIYSSIYWDDRDNLQSGKNLDNRWYLYTNTVLKHIYLYTVTWIYTARLVLLEWCDNTFFYGTLTRLIS